jgi:hypothetical protein
LTAEFDADAFLTDCYQGEVLGEALLAMLAELKNLFVRRT